MAVRRSPVAGMKHEDVWRALDTLAAENGLSASGLAKRAGLDPTPSIRPSAACRTGGAVAQHGKPRQGAEATGASLDAFSALSWRPAPSPGRQPARRRGASR